MVNFADRVTPPPSPPSADPGTITTLSAGVIRGAATPLGAAPPEDDRKHQPTGLEVVGGIISLFAWTVVFAIGIVFPSEPIRNALVGTGMAISHWLILPYLGLFLITYTASNVAFLCCISAGLGELGRRTRIDGAASGETFRRGDYLAAVMRGFLAYLAILTGYVVIGSGVNVFVTPSAEQYVRLAAILSLAGFLIGFNPAIFRRFELSIVDRIITEQKADGSLTRRIESASGVREVVRTEPAPAANPVDSLGDGVEPAAAHGTAANGTVAASSGR